VTGPECGTSWTAYKRHLRRGETCRTCLAWVAARVAASRARKQAEADRG
jgi:hypothetical protein